MRFPGSGSERRVPGRGSRTPGSESEIRDLQPSTLDFRPPWNRPPDFSRLFALIFAPFRGHSPSGASSPQPQAPSLILRIDPLSDVTQRSRDPCVNGHQQLGFRAALPPGARASCLPRRRQSESEPPGRQVDTWSNAEGRPPRCSPSRPNGPTASRRERGHPACHADDSRSPSHPDMIP